MRNENFRFFPCECVEAAVLRLSTLRESPEEILPLVGVVSEIGSKPGPFGWIIRQVEKINPEVLFYFDSGQLYGEDRTIKWHDNFD